VERLYLQAVTGEAQRPILDAINAMPEDMESVRSYWISNAIFAKGASKKLVKTLAGMDAVLEITPDLDGVLHRPHH
jgi:hypothetical protein